MTIAEAAIAVPADGVGAGRSDAKTVGYWMSLGASAGGLGGLVVGGVGGRVGMFILRLTSDDAVRGVQSDDDFTIGRFDLGSTLSLLVVTTVLGIIVGLIATFGRPFFPRRGMPFAWAVAGATAGGGMLIHQDGVDFNLLEPHLLAVGLFVAIPALGAGAIAWLIDVYPRFWWKRRKLTVAAMVPMLAAIPVFPVAVLALVVGGLWWVAMRSRMVRGLPVWKPARATAAGVFAVVVGLGIYDLTKDVPAIV